MINITGVSVARCCIVPENVLPARVNQHVAIVRPKKDAYLSIYLNCAFCATDYKSRLLGISEGGSTRQALTKTDLEKSLVLLPILEIRKKFEKITQKVFNSKYEMAYENHFLKKIKELLLVSIVSKNLSVTFDSNSKMSY